MAAITLHNADVCGICIARPTSKMNIVRSLLFLVLLPACGPTTHARDATDSDAVSAADTGAPRGDGSASLCPAPVVIEHDSMPQTNAMRHSLVQTTRYPTAVCNDGSPASFRFRRGVGRGQRRWMITLEGGGQCGSDRTCQDRWNTPRTRALMTSNNIVDGAIAQEPSTGIRSTSPTDNPDFWDANVVVIDYCSSDLWSGDRAGDATRPVSAVGRWHFRGRAIIAAVLDTLRAEQIDRAEEILVTGGSAGGYGTALNVDDIAERFPSARVVGLMDAAFFIDYPAYDPARQAESTTTPTERHRELLAGIDAWGGRGDASCEAITAQDVRAFCRTTPFLLTERHLSTPLFVRQSIADSVQTNAFIAPSEQGPMPTAYRQRFWSELRNQLTRIPLTAIFATADNAHGVLGDADWSMYSVSSVRLPDAIGAWYRDPCAHRDARIADR